MYNVLDKSKIKMWGPMCSRVSQKEQRFWAGDNRSERKSLPSKNKAMLFKMPCQVPELGICAALGHL